MYVCRCVCDMHTMFSNPLQARQGYSNLVSETEQPRRDLENTDKGRGTGKQMQTHTHTHTPIVHISLDTGNFEGECFCEFRGFGAISESFSTTPTHNR